MAHKPQKFVPDDYEVETGGNDFFKLKSGENKFRILTAAVIGKEGWKDKKPFRRGGTFAMINPKEVDQDEKTGKPKINDYMAFYVYSYADEKIMIASFTQAGIKKAIVDYARDEEWGDPSGYDITVGKTGEGFNTKYTVKASPAKPLPKQIQNLVNEAEPDFDIEKALNIEAE